MDTPTVTELRTWAPPAFAWATYGFPADVDGDALLAVRVGWAAGTLYAVTGRTLASITTLEDVAIAQKVLAALVIMEALGGGPAALKVLEKPWLKSFSAGSYSETRFSPQELAGGSAQAPPYPPALWALLWALMTEEKRDEWLERLTGQRRPAGGFVEVDWGDREPEYGPLLFGPGFEHFG